MEKKLVHSALDLCDQLNKLHDLLWELFDDDFMALVADKYDAESFDDTPEYPF